jgi:hypothetical protein
MLKIFAKLVNHFIEEASENIVRDHTVLATSGVAFCTDLNDVA